MDWTTRVVAWEPGEHLTWQDAAGEGPDAPPPMAVDWTLEAQGGAVTVRLVQSGFGEGDSWDAMYDGLTQGWRFFLWALKHALEVHPGTPRRMVSARRPVPADATVAWERILGADGLAAATPLAEGAPLRLRLGDQQLVGTVAGMRAPTHLWGELESLGRATLLVEVEGGYPQRHLGLWLSTYGLSEAQVAPLEQALTALADRALGGLLPG
jgi:hypothetical protein